MPIYEYHCRGCHGDFEQFVASMNSAAPACPKCKAAKTFKLISRTSAHTSTDYTAPSEQDRPPAKAPDGSCTRCTAAN